MCRWIHFLLAAAVPSPSTHVESKPEQVSSSPVVITVVVATADGAQQLRRVERRNGSAIESLNDARISDRPPAWGGRRAGRQQDEWKEGPPPLP